MAGSLSGLNGVKINSNKEYNNPLATPKDNQVKNIFNDYLAKGENSSNFDVTKDNVLSVKNQIEQLNEKNGVTQTSYDKKTGTRTYSDGSKLIFNNKNDNTSLEYVKKYSDGSMAYGSLGTSGTNGRDTDEISWGASDNKSASTKTAINKEYVKETNVANGSKEVFTSLTNVNTVNGSSKVSNITSNIFN